MKPLSRFLILAATMLATACGPMGSAPEQRRSAPAYPQAPQDVPAKPEALPLSQVPGTPDAPVVKVAILLPLSGESAKLGSAMLDAAMLALYDKYLSLPPAQQTARLVLLPKDTGNSSTTAEQAAREAMEEGATLILGPLYSQSVSAIAPLAKSKGVNIVTFSNNTAIASPGVFIFGFIPDQQVERIAEYSTLRGLNRFAALGPNDAYGRQVTQLFSQIVARRGGTASPMELYIPGANNLDTAVARLSTAYLNTDPSTRFEALFLPEGGAQLVNIMETMRRHQIDRSKIRLLGTGLWDEADVTRSPDLIGGWFASSPPETVKWFEKRFTASYGYQPQRLAGLAYDAVALAAAMALHPSGPSFSASMITDQRGYWGPANGLFRFRADGTSERGLAVMEVTSSGFKTIDPAPKSF